MKRVYTVITICLFASLFTLAKSVDRDIPSEKILEAGGPTVTITLNAGQNSPTNASPVVFRAVFNEAVTGFATGDVTTSASTVGGTLTATVAEIAPNDGTTFTISVTGMTTSGNVVVTIAADICNATGPPGKQNQPSVNVNNTVAFDSAPPAAFTVGSVITTGGTVVAGRWNATNTGVDVTVPIVNDASLTGGSLQLQARVTTGSFANIGAASPIVIGDLGGSKTISLTDVQFEGIATFGDGKIVEVRAVITDLAGNATTGSNSATTITVDQALPGAFTVGSVVTTGGTVKADYWNSTNTGVNVTVPIANDATLTGGTVQLQARIASGTFASIGAPSAIASVNTTKVISLTDAEFEAITGFANGETIQVRAIITDIAGNSRTGTQSATTIIVDQSPPIAFTVGSVITTGGTIVAGFWNSSNTGVDVTVPVDNDATLTGGAVQLQARVTTGTFANIGPSSVIIVGDLGNSKTFSLTSAQFEAITGFAETKIVEIRAIISDIASNSTTGTQSATTITVDQVGPGLTLTKPVGSSYVNNTQVTYTISETLSAATITWTRTGGTADSNHPQTLTGAELTTNQTNYTLTNNPTLVNGSVYTVAFSSSDASGNTTTISNTLVTYDTSPPAAPSTVTTTTTGGTVVANYWNGSNTGVNLGINIPNDNSLVNGTVQIEASSNGTTWNTIASSSSATISSVNTTKTMSITSANILAISGYAQSVSLRFRASLIDQAGNGPSTFTTSSTQLFVDTIKPFILSSTFFANLTAAPGNDPSFTNCNGTVRDKETSREFIHLTMSEPMGQANGTIPTVGTPGFAASTGAFDVTCSDRGASVFHPTNVIHLHDEFASTSPNVDGAWDGNTTLSFSAGGTNVVDVAGNEMASVVTISPGDPNPPVLATGLIFFPNGTGPETIVFQFDETLNGAVTNNVTGFTTSVGVINTLLTNYNSATRTVTLTSTVDGMWTDAVTLSYDQATGNVTDPANNELVAFGGLSPNPAEPIFLKGVNISSNNTTNVAYANVGNIITIGFTASRTLSALPIVTIGGLSANVALTGGLTYSATLVATAGVPDGPITFQIDVTEANTATTVTATTDNSTIKFDKTAPTVVLSDNHADNIVRDADLVTITATFTELNNLNGIPTISISQTSPAISNASMTASANPLIWVYSWDVPAGAVNDGPVNVTIATTDPAGNANTAATGKTSYTIDNTPPTVTIATSSALLGFGTNGTTATSVNFLLTFSGTVPTAVLASDISVNTGNDINIFDAYPGVGFTALVDGNITGSGTTRTVNVTGLSGTGWLKINLNDADNTVTDVAGNPAVDYFTSFTFPGTEAYTRVLPQPSNPITSPTTTRTGTTLTVNWSDAFAPAQQATHYLVMIKKTTVGAFPAVTDGTFIVNDFDLTDNILKQNITFGSTVASFTGLPLTDTYDVIIYPYTLSPNNGSSNINFGTATQVSGSSDIIQNFNYTGNDNILYKDFVESILTSSSKTLEVFDLRDGGGSADADALPTILSGITLTITNWENLNQLGLFSGATLVQQVAVTGPTITFNSLGSTFQAPDDGSATITVKGSFKTIVDDNEVVTFSVSSVTASTVSSSQFLTTTPTGATVTSDATGTQNKIEVVATRIDYTTVPASASISVPLTIQVSARDANANLDADYNGSISATSNTNTGSFTTVNDPTGAFTAGIKDYPVNFQFTTGNGNVQLTINSGAGSGAGNINAAAISGTSPVISVISSFDSWLYFDPSYSYKTRIDFADKQEDPIVSTSQHLARLILSDGGSATSALNLITNPNPGVKNKALHEDADESFTKIDAFTISLTNFQDIRKIALYASDSVTKIGTDKTPAATVTFTGLSSNFAPDNGTYTYYIRASFNQTVTDLDQIAMQVTSVVHNSGSKFSEQQTIPPPTIAGVDGAGAFGDSSPLTNGTGIPLNVLDVIATSLDFVTQPSTYAGINEPLTVNGGNAGVVRSRDQFANLDTEFNYSFVASTPQAGINSSSLPTKFVNGALDLGVPGMRYTSPGDGTITIEANSISSSVSSSPNKIICSKVDVIHVEGTYTSTGVLTSSNIAGGSVNKVIYGVTFDAPYKVSGGEPSLTKFIISFDNPINVLKSYRVFESRNGNSYDGNDISVTTFGGTVTANNTSRTVTVDFTAAPRDFQTVGDPVNKRLSYFLMVDVEATASGSTLPITPTVIDQGYAFPSTDSNILTSKGSATANAQGKKFTFASIFPPTLVASNPAVGKLNIDPNKLTIDLAFSVPVWTLDRKINLYDKTAGTPPITLNAINGFFDNTLTGGPDNATNKATLTGDKLATPLSFAIPSGTLIPDHVYYVLIPSGVYNGVNQPGNTGIMDESGNLFQGISYYGTLYFKTANPTPPVLLADPSPSITDIFSNGATINTTFDQTGKAYFMVVKSTDPMPTNGQIAGRRNDYTGTVIDRGFYSIDKIKPISQFGLTRSDLYTPSTNYNVWIYAENDANPKPIASKGPYGSSASNFAALDTLTAPSTSPATLSFKTSALPVGSGVLINTPTVSICKDSYQFINQPITIYEKTTGDFSAGNVDQVFNLLLPTGYQFDVTLDGSNKPVYGTMTLSGRDAYNPTGTNNTGFVDGFGKLQFINSSTLRVTYRNNGGNTFLDDITISGLKVISTTTLGGRIERLGGNALVATIPDGTALAKLASSVPEGIDFSNSYSEINFPTNLTAINSIPDNFNEPSLLVTLIPEPPVGDYGADSFSGQGVNVDQLSLASVTINSPFNITLTHTDNNGCISQNSLQYTIYDHTTAIRDLSIKYGIYNPNFISSTIKSPAPTGVQKDTVFYTNLPAYFMYTVTADTLRGTKQFISGKAWADVLASLPNIISTTPDPNNTGGAADRFYNTYSLDWATILNAEFSKVDSTLNPYLNRGFRQTTNTNYDYEFFTGGSLGIVEFNADYQSIANASVQLPLKQNVEFFLNPIPVVEVYNPSDVDVNDTNNLPFSNSNSGPPSNLGTLIFCEGGGKISISGFPKATSGSSKGFFVLIDVVSGDTIYYDHPTNSAKDKLPAGFKDFGSGDAELTPNLIINGYQDIKISYTYQDDNSPISGSSYQIIRVTPNPKASFSASSIVASNNVANVKLRTLPDGRPSTFSSYCEDNLISFNNTAQFLDKNSLPVAGYTAKRNPVWVMGDPLNSRNRRDTITDNGVLTLADSVIFKYSDIGTYQVEFSVESQYGCRSNVYSSSVTVGEIPKPGFDITGLSTATPIVVTNTTKSSIPPNGSITTNSGWNFGDPYQPDLNLMVFGALNTNTYPKPGHYTVTLKATTTAGCEISYQRPVIIVPAVTLSATQTQTTDDFESNIQTKQWQTSSTDTLKSSWVRGVSKKDSLRLKTNVWITKIKDDYNPNEESYLYSPVYDLSSLARPMISFDQAANLAKNDGVTLEFSVDDLNVADSTKKWYRLGIKGEGTNWYDEAGLASKPGDQFKYPETIISSGDYGWSRKDSSSRSSRHALSPDLPSKSRVVFRFALSSVSGSGDQGFALDNFRIGDRTRTVLIENFTNKGTSNPDEKTESDYLKTKFPGVVGTDYIKINYHVGFPGVDPFNTTNPADPSARALYYNVSKTPTAFMDSYDDPFPLNSVNRVFSKWGATKYGSQSLELAGADIAIDTFPSKSGIDSVLISVTAKKDLPASTILHFGVLEEKISLTSPLIKTGEKDFEYVLKKLLPTAAGTRFGTLLKKGETRKFKFDKIVLDPGKFFSDDIALVAFLQDENTKEVHQSELKSGLKVPAVVTGIEEILPEQVNVYPNPASSEFKVELPSIVQNEVKLHLIDMTGRKYEKGMIPSGGNSATVNVEDLSEGIYILEIGNGNTGIIRKKIMVVMKN